MSRPWKHPKSGVYWFRKAVPAELRALVGKREEKFSLNTKDPAEARRRHAVALAKIDERWSNLRSGPRAISEREAHELAIDFYSQWLSQYRDKPSAQTFWDTELCEKLFLARPSVAIDSHGVVQGLIVNDEDFRLGLIERECLGRADQRLAERGLDRTEENTFTLAKAIAAALQRASLDLHKIARGEGVVLTAPSHTNASMQSVKHEPTIVTFDQIIEGWAKERRPAEKTVYEWTRAARQLETFLGHANVARISADDMLSWKRSMVDAELRSKTIQDAKLAPIRTLLQWASKNKLIAANAAEGVSIDVRTKAAERKRSFTDDEARLILSAALKETNAVRRWAPWIGAYTGARVSEICQLRKEDVQQIEGIWCIRFTAEAGSLKTDSSERIVPIHPALIDNGFVNYITSCKAGPIFADLSPDKFGKRGGNGTKMIGRFVRQLGIVDPRLSPSHSWRHRIKTSGRKYGLAPDILNAITGHGSRSVADSYGEFPVSALARELVKIPTLKMN